MAGRGATVGVNSGLVAGGKAVGAALSLWAFAIAARALSLEELGSLVALHALVLFCSEALTFKTSLAVVRFGTGPAMRGDTGALAKVLRFCVTLDLISSAVAFVVSVAAGLALRQVIPDLAALPLSLVVGYLGLVLLRQISASLGTLRLLGRFGTLAGHALIQPIVRLIGGYIAWEMGLGLAAFVIIYFAASAISHAALIGLALWRLACARLWDAIPRRLSLAAPDPTAWRFSIISNLETTLGTVTTDAPVVLAAILLGSDGAAIFKAAQDAASLLTGGVKIVDRTMFPELAKLAAAGARDQLIRLAMKASAVLAAIGGVLALGVLWLGPAPLIAIFDKPEYGQAAGPLALLFLGAALSGAGTPFLPAFYANGRPGQALIARSAEAFGFLGLVWPLSALFGVSGTASAILAGSAGFALLAFWLAYRQSWTPIDQGAGDLGGHADNSASRTSPATSPTETDKSGGPGQPASGRDAPAKLGAPSYRGRA